MKRKFTQCDVCGRSIDERITGWQKIKIKVRRYKNEPENWDDFEFRKWKRIDLCHKCANNMFRWVKSAMSQEEQNG